MTRILSDEEIDEIIVRFDAEPRGEKTLAQALGWKPADLRRWEHDDNYKPQSTNE